MIREFQDISLKERNSFGVEQKAAHLVEFENTDDLDAFFAKGIPSKWMVLSGGNNILFTKDYEGVLLTPVSQKIEILAEEGDRVSVRVDAGVEWDDLVEWAVERNLWGVENLSLIPGKAGAAPVQNIGAYGREAAHVIRRVEYYNTTLRQVQSIEAADCHFGYRESIFKHQLKGKVIITSIEIELSHTAQPHMDYGDVKREVEARGGVSLHNIRQAICSIRRSKLPDPKIMGNAGSFFKNPIVADSVADALRQVYPDMPSYPSKQEGYTKLAAGWLIDRAGMKGYESGAVGVHHRQALVLVNLGGATGGEVIEFAHMIQQKVKDRFGIEIDTEVNII